MERDVEEARGAMDLVIEEEDEPGAQSGEDSGDSGILEAVRNFPPPIRSGGVEHPRCGEEEFLTLAGMACCGQPPALSPFATVARTQSPFATVARTQSPLGAVPGPESPLGAVPGPESPLGAVPRPA